jgi:hypothetical protein
MQETFSQVTAGKREMNGACGIIGSPGETYDDYEIYPRCDVVDDECHNG